MPLWDGIETNPNTPIIENTITHHGASAISASLTAALGALKWADIYKELGYYEALYYRANIRVSALPAAGNRVHVLWFGTVGLTSNTAGICIFHDGVSAKWQVYGDAFDYLAASAVEPQINTWYPVELYYKRGAGDGEAAGWVNNVSIGSAGSKSYSNYPYYAHIGILNTQGGTTATVIGDCVTVSTERIYAEVVNIPIVYPTVVVKEATQLPSTSSALIQGHGARVRRLKHTTSISPWTAR